MTLAQAGKVASLIIQNDGSMQWQRFVKDDRDFQSFVELKEMIFNSNSMTTEEASKVISDMIADGRKYDFNSLYEKL
jgi:hypothetical protein